MEKGMVYLKILFCQREKQDIAFLIGEFFANSLHNGEIEL